MGVLAGKAVNDWSKPIGDVAELFMNATFRIVRFDQDPIEPFDVATNTGGIHEPIEVWEGPGRIQHIYTSRGSNIDGDSTRNPTGQRTVLFNIALDAVTEKIDRGWQVRVIDPGKDVTLTEYLFYVDSAFNSSWAAQRTIAASTDAEARPGWV